MRQRLELISESWSLRQRLRLSREKEQGKSRKEIPKRCLKKTVFVLIKKNFIYFFK